MFQLVLAALVLGGSVYYGLVIRAARRHAGRLAPSSRGWSSKVSVLKPLAGLELGLEDHLRSFFALDYPDFELLFAVRDASDPAAATARRLIAEHPNVPAELHVTGAPPSLEQYPNAKVYSLIRLAACARGDGRGNDLQGIAADFADARVGVSTCPYRAAPGGGLWSRLEAIGMNTEFWGGVLTAQSLSPMDFAVGPTMAIRRACLDELGGFEATRDYLAEDFVLGQWARQRGWQVVLSKQVVDHHIGSSGFLENFKHRIRWYRSTRRSRPLGYLGQIFTNPLPLAVLLALATDGAPWRVALLGLCAILRAGAAQAGSGEALHVRLSAGDWLLLPLQDLASLVVWCLAFFGNSVVWRGRRFHLTREGLLRPGS